MATYTINSLTDWKQLPFSEFTIVFSGNTINFKNLMEGAAVYVRPITRIDEFGQPFPVAYKIEASADILEKDYEDMSTQIQLINKSTPTRIDFVLKGDTSQLDIQVKDSINAANWGCYAEIVAEGDFPKMRITMTGLFSPDVIDMTTNKLFKQNWS